MYFSQCVLKLVFTNAWQNAEFLNVKASGTNISHGRLINSPRLQPLNSTIHNLQVWRDGTLQHAPPTLWKLLIVWGYYHYDFKIVPAEKGEKEPNLVGTYEGANLYPWAQNNQSNQKLIMNKDLFCVQRW
jgi:hypothetical protein